jgi:hypothetical protein
VTDLWRTPVPVGQRLVLIPVHTHGTQRLTSPPQFRVDQEHARWQANKTDISRNELSSARQNSRFIQAPSAQMDQRIPDLPDKPSREPRPQARSLSADGHRPRHRTSDRQKANARAHESPDMAPQMLSQAPQEHLVPPTPSPPPIERSYSSPIHSSFLMLTLSTILVHLSLVQALENGCLCHHSAIVFRKAHVADWMSGTARH